MNAGSIALLLLLALACGPGGGELEGEAGVWIDLTHPLGADSLYWPTGTAFELEVLSRGADPVGRWYAANRFRTPEHLGTHLDAPFHFYEQGWKADEVPVERMRGPAFVIDARAEAERDRDLAVGAELVRGFEARHGALPAGAVVLVRTGWDARWSDRVGYFGSAASDASDLHFPGLGADAAELLVERGVAAVGIDTASIDPGTSQTFETHRVLARANVLIYENLAHLDRLPETGASFQAFALPIRGGTGGPVRAVARIRE
jgi:kynurenine formamidase